MTAPTLIVPQGMNMNPTPANARWITKLAFHDRFTMDELVAIEMACIDNPQADMATRALSAGLRVNMKKIEMAQYIDLNRTDTHAGVQALEIGGLIAPGRAAQILNNPIEPQEIYHG